MTSARRVALVTGGGRGIGRAIALGLANAGVDVAVAARTTAQVDQVAEELRALGVRAHASSADVADPASVEALVAGVAAALGPIDILVNNAGVAESARLTRTDDALWQRMLAVNLTGVFLCMRAVLPSMIERRFGRIINVASVAAKVGFAYTSAYSAAKHGVLGLTRSAALEVATGGVTVNAICPGWVDTDMTTASIARIVEKTGRSADEARASLERMSPQQRLVRPEEVALVAVMLASEDAGGITGQAINVDGGEVMF
jgi:NAD(P)-dependent dehydrogenase (short-subunit alcohol dehydrogenase family)